MPHLVWAGQYDSVHSNSIAPVLGSNLGQSVRHEQGMDTQSYARGMQPPQTNMQCLPAQQNTHLSAAQNCGQQACDNLTLPGVTDAAMLFWKSPAMALRLCEQDSAEGQWGMFANGGVDQGPMKDEMLLDFGLGNWNNWVGD